MLKIIFGFLPWILYFILVGTTRHQHEVAIIVALAATVLFDFHELKKGFILPWGSVIFFSFLFIVTIIFSLEWFEAHANILANTGLASIVWISLLINKPFTLQYAREQVAKAYWNTPIFIRINQMITMVWGISFLIAIGINIFQLFGIIANYYLYQILSYGPSIVAIIFTKKFPDWYRQRRINKLIQNSENLQSSNPFLQGNFSPVTDELDVKNLSIEGEIPKDLFGIYMRNGSNPAFPPFSYTYPFDGDGMLHAVYLENGKASYKNRFIETHQLQVERRVGKAVYGGLACPFIRDSRLLQPGDSMMPVKLGRFIHIIRHAEQYIALHESTSAYAVNAKLETIGEWNPTQSEAAIDVNAHTRLDPETGELFFISYHSDKPIVTYHIFDKNGQCSRSGTIDVPYKSMIHDFVLTKNFIIIFLCPVVIDFENFLHGKPFANWQPEFNTRIALFSRENLKDTTWIETEPFFTYHFANAYEIDGKIGVDYVRYPVFTMETKNLQPSHLFQTTIDFIQKKCSHKQIDNHDIEFPRINDNFNANPYRYIYVTENNMHTLIKYDLKTQNILRHDFGINYEIGEAVFASKMNSQDEDDGYLMLFVYDKVKDESDFIILDSKNFTDKPLAKIKLPRRIPHGLHGSWMPGKWE